MLGFVDTKKIRKKLQKGNFSFANRPFLIKFVLQGHFAPSLQMSWSPGNLGLLGGLFY